MRALIRLSNPAHFQIYNRHGEVKGLRKKVWCLSATTRKKIHHFGYIWYRIIFILIKEIWIWILSKAFNHYHKYSKSFWKDSLQYLLDKDEEKKLASRGEASEEDAAAMVDQNSHRPCEDWGGLRGRICNPPPRRSGSGGPWPSVCEGIGPCGSQPLPYLLLPGYYTPAWQRQQVTLAAQEQSA